MFAVTWQFSNCGKNTFGHGENVNEKTTRTCRTVTGTLTPLSSYMLVIPRFRAMRPVRIEFGVHFGAAFVVSVANSATVELKCLTLVDGERFHSRSIARSRRECGGMVLIWSGRACSTGDGHVRVPIHFRCKYSSCKRRFAHLAWRIWPGIDRTDLSCRSALFTDRYPRQIHTGGINNPRLFSQWFVESYSWTIHLELTNKCRAAAISYS